MKRLEALNLLHELWFVYREYQKEIEDGNYITFEEWIAREVFKEIDKL